MADLFGVEAPAAMKSDARISDCGRYRYSLTRVWDHSRDYVYWIMLNPSTADASADDPTIRRCVNFALAWGYGGIDVRNLFALRATDPKQLRKVADPVGPDNDPHYICGLCTRTHRGPVIAAWGTHGNLLGRDARVLRLLNNWGVEVHCLERTKGGHPKHPLYCKADLKPVVYQAVGKSY